MEHWIYKKKSITCLDDIKDYEKITGFVYLITRIDTGKIYVGKKVLHHSRRTRISKREKVSTQTRKVFKKTVKESDWAKYFGSSKELSAEVKLLGTSKFKREILEFCYSKKHLAYCEAEYQFKEDVLRKDTYNANILGRWFKKDVII